MIKTDFKNVHNGVGGRMAYRMYQPSIASRNYLLHLHGDGQFGPPDGSQLGELEQNGYPERIKQGHSYPFNIVCPQVESGYSSFVKWAVAWMCSSFPDMRGFGAAGISLGAMAVYDMLAWDPFFRLDFIVPVCGRDEASTVQKKRAIDGLAWHGDKDTTVDYSADRKFIEAYNRHHSPHGEITLMTIPNVGHNAWDYAFEGATGPTFVFIQSKWRSSGGDFNEGFTAGKEHVKNAVQTTINSL